MKKEANAVDDLMMLLGWQKKTAINSNRYGKFTQIKVEAENAWLEGANADANPYNERTQNVEYWAWYRTWKECNVNC